MKTLIAMMMLGLCMANAGAQTKAVTKQPKTDRLIENLKVPSGKTLTIESGGTLTADVGATVNGISTSVADGSVTAAKLAEPLDLSEKTLTLPEVFVRTDEVYFDPEFISGLDWAKIEDPPSFIVAPSLAGQMGKLLAVNEDEDGFVLIDPPSGGGVSDGASLALGFTFPPVIFPGVGLLLDNVDLAGGKLGIEYEDAAAAAGQKLILNVGGATRRVTLTGDVTLSGMNTGDMPPAGSGSELQFRSSASALGAVTGSSVSGGNVTLGGTFDAAGMGLALQRALTDSITQIGWDSPSYNNAGSGGGFGDSSLIGVSSGSTASSRCQGSKNVIPLLAHDQSGAVDFSQPITVSFVIQMVATSTNGKAWWKFGGGATTVGDQNAAGFGIRIDGDTLKGFVHNDSSLTVSAGIFTFTGNKNVRVTIQSDGAGGVKFYLDGVLATTLTGGPTAPRTFSVMAAETQNYSDAETVYWIFGTPKFYLAP